MGATTLGGGGGSLAGSADVPVALSFTMQAPFTDCIFIKARRL
jgi:hypothetical protein